MLTVCTLTASWAQGVKPLPTLHVDGMFLADTHGNHVVLHGVMVPRIYFSTRTVGVGGVTTAGWWVISRSW